MNKPAEMTRTYRTMKDAFAAVVRMTEAARARGEYPTWVDIIDAGGGFRIVYFYR